MDERDQRLMRRLEVFYTFTGLLAPKKIVQLKKTTEASNLIKAHINQKFLDSECVKTASDIVNEAFKKCETLPSFCNKIHRETNRLYYKRRHKKELENLVIIKASDVLFRLEHELEYNNKRREVMYVRKEGLKMATNLLKTNQVVLLIDEAKLSITSWAVESILIDKLNLKFDAIYTYSSSISKPSGYFIDISQIVLDFRLFSSY